MARFVINSLFAYSFRHSWLAFYVVLNIVAACLILGSGELIGDVKGSIESHEDTVVSAAFLIACSYLVLLWPVFNSIYRIKVTPVKLHRSEEVIGERVGVLVLLFQFLFMASNLLYGTSIAGAGNIQSGNKLTYLFILFDPDFLFLIYYGIYRERKLFYPNLAIYIVSGLLRGWAGIFLFILFFETCRSYRKGSLTLKKLVLVLFASIALYPFVTAAKWVVRANAFSGTTIVESIATVIGELESSELEELVAGGVEHMVDRLQSVSVLVDVMQRSTRFEADYISGRFLPFWLEGLHGIIYDRLFLGNLFSSGERMPVAVINWEYNYSPVDYEGVGNVAISYPGWFFIAPYMTPLYILYTFFLGGVSIYLVKKMSGSESAKDMVWLVWLVYLMAPWLGAMFKFIYSALFFLAFMVAFSKLPRLTIRLSSVVVDH